ncbi:MAG: hypothetical protein WBP54_09420, partial [Pelodictyon phaeoclathratiforme]
VLRFLIEYRKRTNGETPTIREILDGTSVTSTSVVTYCLNKLDYYGYIELVRIGNKYRTIKIPGEKYTIELEYDIDKILEA